MKPIIRQLIIGGGILVLVTVASLGIRHVRFSAHRAKPTEISVIANPEDQLQPEQPPRFNTEPDPQYVEVSELDSDWEETPSDDYSEANNNSAEYVNASSMTKSFESDYGKSEGSKGFEKIFLGDNENLYIGKEGRAWYVSKGPDGKTTKMLVQIDETTGEMKVVGIAGKGNYAKSDGSQGIQKISMGDNDNLYITQEGEFWYTSSGSKALVDIDDSTGEIIVIKQFNSDGEKDATTTSDGKSEY